MSLLVRIESLASEKTFSRNLVPDSSELLRKTNFKDPDAILNLQNSILGRLTSGYNEMNLKDVLIFFDMHTIMHFHCLDSEV